MTLKLQVSMNTTLLILAAGMGSRYGGMKQVDSFGPSGETITDYSIYDAIQAGFDRFVFVISPQMEEEFRTSYIQKFPSNLKVDYVIQSIEHIPKGLPFRGSCKALGYSTCCTDGKGCDQ